jgi:hypothetical protein
MARDPTARRRAMAGRGDGASQRGGGGGGGGGLKGTAVSLLDYLDLKPSRHEAH